MGTMLKVARDMIKRLGFVGGLVLALLFAAPVVEAHACAAEPVLIADGLFLVETGDHGDSCPDCGPACANMCCHAPHLAIANALPQDSAHDVEHPAHWTHQNALATAPPSGPDQPPRS